MGPLSLWDGLQWGGRGILSVLIPCVQFPALPLRHGTGSGDVVLSAFFSVLCLTASSPKSFPPPGSSLSCLGSDSSSPRSPWPALASGPNSRKQVTLLPPFLSDQAQQVQALGTFYLFCQATGPADVRFIWEKNRHVLDTCVPMQTHVLSDGRAHALSWLRDTIQETTEYSCSVLSSAGNQTSKVHITVMRHEALQQEKWSQELAAWRAVAGEHDRLMQGWRKAWESCSKDTF